MHMLCTVLFKLTEKIFKKKLNSLKSPDVRIIFQCRIRIFAQHLRAAYYFINSKQTPAH